jgi:ribosome-associated protein
VASGAVKVDGAVELRKTCKIRAGQFVTLDDVEIHVLADPLGEEDGRPSAGGRG